MDNKIIKPHFIKFNKIGNITLGYISVAEHPENVPFEIKRVYWTYYTPNDVLRGHHAHKNLHQVITAVHGVIRFKLEHFNGNAFEFLLDSPEKCLYIPPGYWREIQFSNDAVLLCVASEKYEESDYIRDYEAFKSIKSL
jgi:dTDP-4-dehydrorhamnose 3,5-epimerase-like enzyme